MNNRPSRLPNAKQMISNSLIEAIDHLLEIGKKSHSPHVKVLVDIKKVYSNSIRVTLNFTMLTDHEKSK